VLEALGGATNVGVEVLLYFRPLAGDFFDTTFAVHNPYVIFFEAVRACFVAPATNFLDLNRHLI
jgi:hypothetical protein